MNFTNFLTILGAAGAAVLPVVTPFIPPPYNAALSVLITAASGLYHLYQPSPSAPAPVTPAK
jgi:hypothetical protein